MNLKNKKVIITGGSTGLGKEILKTFIHYGADVITCSRNLETLSKTIIGLKKLSTYESQVIKGLECDISDPEKTEEFFSTSINEMNGLDVLVNNAGIYGPIGASEEIDIESWKKSIDINLNGPFHLCQLAIKYFKIKKEGKIINLSGGGATSPLPFISSYAASKAALVRLTETLANEVDSYGIEINAIAPGALNTRLLDQVLKAGADNVGNHFYEKALKQKSEGGAPLSRGAALCAYLASEKSGKINGKLISAIWDPLENLVKHFENSSSSDIYTLRRIIPEDRGENW